MSIKQDTSLAAVGLTMEVIQEARIFGLCRQQAFSIVFNQVIKYMAVIWMIRKSHICRPSSALMMNSWLYVSFHSCVCIINRSFCARKESKNGNTSWSYLGNMSPITKSKICLNLNELKVFLASLLGKKATFPLAFHHNFSSSITSFVCFF